MPDLSTLRWKWIIFSELSMRRIGVLAISCTHFSIARSSLVQAIASRIGASVRSMSCPKVDVYIHKSYRSQAETTIHWNSFPRNSTANEICGQVKVSSFETKCQTVKMACTHTHTDAFTRADDSSCGKILIEKNCIEWNVNKRRRRKKTIQFCRPIPRPNLAHRRFISNIRRHRIARKTCTAWTLTVRIQTWKKNSQVYSPPNRVRIVKKTTTIVSKICHHRLTHTPIRFICTVSIASNICSQRRRSWEGEQKRIVAGPPQG